MFILFTCAIVFYVFFTFFCHMGRDGQIYASVLHNTLVLYLNLNLKLQCTGLFYIFALRSHKCASF